MYKSCFFAVFTWDYYYKYYEKHLSPFIFFFGNLFYKKQHFESGKSAFLSAYIFTKKNRKKNSLMVLNSNWNDLLGTLKSTNYRCLVFALLNFKVCTIAHDWLEFFSEKTQRCTRPFLNCNFSITKKEKITKFGMLTKHIFSCNRQFKTKIIVTWLLWYLTLKKTSGDTRFSKLSGILCHFTFWKASFCRICYYIIWWINAVSFRFFGLLFQKLRIRPKRARGHFWQKISETIFIFTLSKFVHQ